MRWSKGRPFDRVAAGYARTGRNAGELPCLRSARPRRSSSGNGTFVGSVARGRLPASCLLRYASAQVATRISRERLKRPAGRRRTGVPQQPEGGRRRPSPSLRLCSPRCREAAQDRASSSPSTSSASPILPRCSRTSRTRVRRRDRVRRHGLQLRHLVGMHAHQEGLQPDGGSGRLRRFRTRRSQEGRVLARLLPVGPDVLQISLLPSWLDMTFDPADGS